MAQRASQRAWYERNRERVLAERAVYRAAHAPELATYQRAYHEREPRLSYKTAWRAAHPDSGRAAKAAWSEAHRDLLRARTAAWSAANPERMRDHQRRRRARVREVTMERFTEAEIYERDGWRCQLCGETVSPNIRFPAPLAPSLDHIVPISRGGPHSRANVQLAHFVCNQRKGSRHGE